jgi:hypothetical protein
MVSVVRAEVNACHGAAVTKDHKLGAYHRNLFFHSSGDQRSEVKVLQGHAPSTGWRGGSFLPGPAALAVFGSCPHHSGLCIRHHTAFVSVPFRLP